ncbi:hypothetical protein F0P96_08490 [Hymenobacter busanensis]|uniref:NTF2 fold domain-containing protein n=1 Tax=Hymenobacter busanensis TaxID=2607656 RepID=A0A7L4ZZE5_9BACT|nr:NTF2 fold immunity protein [Hymenobacter busanensis]KAA9333013.1 hypothetical protein F0P96_08490 [Hymenobacter busanensis]QHJ08313.1 hypothetical protein GUY19_13840 [Hymenobacter busanensis]
MLRLFSLAAVLLLALSQTQGQTRSYPADPVPKQGYIPDASTAVNVAEALWVSLYGPSVYQRKPYRVVLRDSSVWVVYGTGPAGVKEEVPTIEINKQDGRILKTSGKTAMQGYARKDSLTVLVRVAGPKHERYIIYYRGRKVMTTPRGAPFLGSFNIPINNQQPNAEVDILLFRKNWLGIRRYITLGIPLRLEYRYLILNRNPACKKRYAFDYHYDNEEPGFFY